MQRAIWLCAHVTARRAASNGSACSWFDLSLHQMFKARLPAAQASGCGLGGDRIDPKWTRYSLTLGPTGYLVCITLSRPPAISILGVRGQTISGAVMSTRHTTYLGSHMGQMQIMIGGIRSSSPHCLKQTPTVLANHGALGDP